MLFLTKKTIVAVLALSTLLSIAPRTHAVETRTILAGTAALATAYLAGVHNAKDEGKHAALRTLDLPANYLQRFLNFVTSKQGVVALGAGAAAYALVTHGKDVKDINAVRLVTNLLDKAKQ